MNETVAGDVVVDTPAVMPRRLTLPAWMRQDDEEHRSAYRALRANLATLARWAWLVVPAVVSLAVLTFVWNNRRLPEPAAARPGHSRTSAAVRAIALRLTRGDPEAQAGFFFTLHALMRSGPHRLIVAIAVAAALTLPSVMLILGSAYVQEPMSSFPLGLLGMQVTVLLVLIGGFRYVVMVPAELVANWSIRMAWRGDERGYLAGVKRAAFLSTVVVPSLVLLPLHVALFGAATALVHALFGCLFGVAALDGLFLGYRKSLSPAPICRSATRSCCGRAAPQPCCWCPISLRTSNGPRCSRRESTAAFAATLAGIVLTIKIIDRLQRRERQPLDFDERPAPPTQRLGVFESMAIHE